MISFHIQKQKEKVGLMIIEDTRLTALKTEPSFFIKSFNVPYLQSGEDLIFEKQALSIAFSPPYCDKKE